MSGIHVRHLSRWARNVCVALSLLLCVGTCALWVRSYRRTDRYCWWDYGRDTGSYSEDFATGSGVRVVSERGRIALVRNEHIEPVWFAPLWDGYTSSPAPSRAAVDIALGLIDMPHQFGIEGADVHRWLGFEVSKYRVIEPYNSFVLPEDVRAAPLAFFAVALGVLPAMLLRRVVRERRMRPAGLCPGCGYDIRATPAKCPECGPMAATADDAPAPGAV